MKCRYCEFEHHSEWHLERHLNKEHREERQRDKKLLYEDLTLTFEKGVSLGLRGRSRGAALELTRKKL